MPCASKIHFQSTFSRRILSLVPRISWLFSSLKFCAAVWSLDCEAMVECVQISWDNLHLVFFFSLSSVEECEEHSATSSGEGGRGGGGHRPGHHLLLRGAYGRNHGGHQQHPQQHGCPLVLLHHYPAWCRETDKVCRTISPPNAHHGHMVTT